MANPNSSYTRYTYFSQVEWLQERGALPSNNLTCIVTQAMMQALDEDELKLLAGTQAEKLQEWSSLIEKDLGPFTTWHRSAVGGENVTKMLTTTQAWQAKSMAADLVSEFAASLPNAN